MADGEERDPMRDVYLFITFLVIVIIFWYAGGGPGRASLNGIFLNAPPPLSNGQSYGPQFPVNGSAPTTTATTSQDDEFQTGTVPPPQPISNY